VSVTVTNPATRLSPVAESQSPFAPRKNAAFAERKATEERRRARSYPISRWYLRPAAGYLARLLAPTTVRPVHLTACGLVAAACAAAVLIWLPEAMPTAAALILTAWLLDRADGQLARLQHTASAFGAWLDANVDELIDLGLHVAVAQTAAALSGSSLPWFLLIGFLVGKYLLMYGLAVEEARGPAEPHTLWPVCRPSHCGDHTLWPVSRPSHAGDRRSSMAEETCGPRTGGVRRPAPSVIWLRRAWHLPGNADVRVHLLAAGVLTGWLTAELALVAAYYNLRWVARYGLVARRLGGAPR